MRIWAALASVILPQQCGKIQIIDWHLSFFLGQPNEFDRHAVTIVCNPSSTKQSSALKMNGIDCLGNNIRPALFWWQNTSWMKNFIENNSLKEIPSRRRSSMYWGPHKEWRPRFRSFYNFLEILCPSFQILPSRTGSQTWGFTWTVSLKRQSLIRLRWCRCHPEPSICPSGG